MSEHHPPSFAPCGLIPFTRQSQRQPSLSSRVSFPFAKSRSSVVTSRHYVPTSSAQEKRPRRGNDPSESPSEETILPHLPPIGPTPSETSGYDGWRDEDDAYWRNVRESIVSFRATSTFKPEDLKAPSHPCDRHGNPTTYPAAARYDPTSKTWVPTSEEEEERLKLPNPVKDPYFISEAAEDEEYPGLRDRTSDNGKQNEPCWTPVEQAGPSLQSSTLLDPSTVKRKKLEWGPHGWKVVHLGTSSAVPTRTRNVSSVAFLANNDEPDMFLVDAGENTSRRLLECDWCLTHGFRWIRAIFITHLHGDHIYGLPTLLTNIGRFAQYRRRAALENGDDGSDPVIRIFGPYGTRGFVRSSLYWTNPVGVKFSVSELVPRATDFCHIRQADDFQTNMFISDGEGTEFVKAPELEEKGSPPPHPEEVRADDICVSGDGVWHVWKQSSGEAHLEVVAAPLKHRLPCFGYVFRESSRAAQEGDEQHPREELQLHTSNGTVSNANATQKNVQIDMEKARALGVYGSQFRVLRAGRSVRSSKTGLEVRPEDVTFSVVSHESGLAVESHITPATCDTRKVTILGDTCDSGLIANAANGSDLLIHEATFTDFLKQKAKVAMHSTARMAGAFGKSIAAKKIALTHFSSRHEVQLMERAGSDNTQDDEEDDEENDDFASPNQLVSEARKGYGDGIAEIVAAYDFMEHDIPLMAAREKTLESSRAVVKLQ